METSEAKLPKFKRQLVMPSEAWAIEYLFTTCPLNNYLFYENSVLKYLFQKYSIRPGD